MKYIRHENLGMILFGEEVTHKSMVQIMGMPKELIVSAGFVKVYDGKVSCFGESTTLGKESNPDDINFIQGQLIEY